jgi:hypothetical protein
VNLGCVPTTGRPWPEGAPLEAVAQDMVARGRMVAEPASEPLALREEWATMEPAPSGGCQLDMSVAQDGNHRPMVGLCQALQMLQRSTNFEPGGLMRNRFKMLMQVLQWLPATLT